MALREVVSCWVSRDLPAGTDLADVRESLKGIGFSVAKEWQSGKIRLKRGSQLGGFDYDTEGLEVQVVLDPKHDRLRMYVGNWGFPFEPPRMKVRFARLAERFMSDISENGKVIPLENEHEQIKDEVHQTRQNAVRVALSAGAGALIAYLGVVTWWGGN